MIELMLFLIISSTDTLHLNIEQAIETALMNNAEVKQLRIEYEKMKWKTDEAISAWYPQISASGYYAYLSDLPIFTIDSMPVPMGQHENYSFQVSLQQVLFSWGKLHKAYKISALGEHIARLKLKRKEQELRYEVTNNFYNLLVLNEMVKLTEQSLEQLQLHADAVKKRFDAGLVPRFELLRAQVQVANLKPRLIEAKNGLRIAQEGFKLLLGLPLDQVVMPEGELKITEQEFQLDTLIQTALKQRIELRELKDTKSIARLGREIRARANLPTLVAGATYERKKPFGFTENEWGSNITFNIGFQFPLFTGFKNLAQYQEARLNLRQAELALDNLIRAIRFEVKRAYLDFLASKEKVESARENVEQAKKAFEIIETRYNNGLATNLEYLDTQLALTQAKTNYLLAIKDYHSARAEIFKAIGKEE